MYNSNMEINNSLELKLIRLLKTRPLETLMDKKDIEKISSSLPEITKRDKDAAAVYVDSSCLHIKLLSK